MTGTHCRDKKSPLGSVSQEKEMIVQGWSSVEIRTSKVKRGKGHQVTVSATPPWKKE